MNFSEREYEADDLGPDYEPQENRHPRGMRPMRTPSKGAMGDGYEGMFAVKPPVNRLKKATPIEELLPFHDISVDAIPIPQAE